MNVRGLAGCGCPIVWLTLALWASIAALPVLPAQAQGTRGVLPDPISAGDIDRLAGQLSLSEAQRQAVDRIHQTYLDRFHELRDGPVERFLQAHPKAVSYYADVPDDPAAGEPAARELRRLDDRIRRLDDSFFDQVQEILGPEQVPALPRARDARQRTRWRQGSAWVTASPYLQTDMGLLLDELDLTPAQREAALPLVQTYERKLASALRKLDDVTSSLQVEMGKLRIAVTEAAQEPLHWVDAHVLRALFTELSALAAEVGAVHRQAVEQWRPVLPASAFDELQRNYHRAVYADVPPGYGPAERLFEDLAGDETLTADQRQSIDAAEQLYRQSAQRVKDRMLDVIDAMRVSTAAHPLQFSWGQSGAEYYEDRETYTDRLKPLRAELDEANQTAAATLSAVTGRPLEVAHIPIETTTEPGRDLVFGSTTGGGDSSRYFYYKIPLAQLALEFGAGAMHFLPGPIPEDDLARYADQLALDEGDQAVLAGIHETYLDAFRGLRGDGPVGRVRRLEATLFQRDAAGRVEIPTIAQIDDLFTLRRDAVRAIILLDRAFHDDLALVWTDEAQTEAIDRLALRRLREVYRCGGPGGTIPFIPRPLFMLAPREIAAPPDAEGIDIELAALLEQAGATREAARADELRARLLRAESELTELLAELSESRLALEHERARIMAAHLRPEDAGTFCAERVPASATMIELDEQVHRLLIAVRELNRSARDELAQILPAGARWGLRAAYRRAGHPGLHSDALCASRALTAALELDDLDQPQREEIGELARTYAVEDEALCERIIAALDDRQARQRYESERAELYQRTWSRLEALLTAEQVAMVKVLSRAPPR